MALIKPMLYKRIEIAATGLGMVPVACVRIKQMTMTAALAADARKTILSILRAALVDRGSVQKSFSSLDWPAATFLLSLYKKAARAAMKMI